ncbi:MAG: response regulator transcription factor [Candidatus Sericytochromatia bacterium]|nr:response regulator transcription factor [Candidatus Sericytochromatia bacterium]
MMLSIHSSSAASETNGTSALRLLLIEDHPLTRLGIQHMLAHADWPLFQNINITAAGTAAETLESLQQNAFDVAVLDLHLPDGGGLELVARIQQVQPSLRVLLHSAAALPLPPPELMQQGIIGYVHKMAAPQYLVEAILAIYYGGVYFPSEPLPMLGQTDMPLAEAADARPDDRGPVVKLSFREEQVLKMLAADRNKHEIAAELAISVRTVETYRTRLMKKLNCRSLVGLIHYALEQGIVKL